MGRLRHVRTPRAMVAPPASPVPPALCAPPTTQPTARSTSTEHNVSATEDLSRNNTERPYKMKRFEPQDNNSIQLAQPSVLTVMPGECADGDYHSLPWTAFSFKWRLTVRIGTTHHLLLRMVVVKVRSHTSATGSSRT